MSGLGTSRYVAGMVSKGAAIFVAGATVFGVLSVVAGVSTASAFPGHTYVVTTATDAAGTGNCATGGSCTLRQAVDQYNSDSSGPDTITFSANGDFGISSFGTLDVANPDDVALTITGNGPTKTMIDGSGCGCQDLLVDSANQLVTMSGVTIENGSTGGFGGGLEVIGCASVSLTNSVLSDNYSGSEGGGIWNGNCDPVSLSDVILTDNSAQWGAGIYSRFGGLTVTASTFSDNVAQHDAGAIYSFGLLSVSNSNFTSNVATTGYAGAIENHGLASITGGVIGGTASAANTAEKGGGGGIVNEDGASLTLSGTIVSYNGAAFGAGIAAYEATTKIIGATVSQNSATGATNLLPYGGGIFNQSAGMTLSGTDVEDNSANQVGGGIENFDGNLNVKDSSTVARNSAAFSGGGIENDCGTANISSSAVDTNQTSLGTGGGVNNYTHSSCLVVGPNSGAGGDPAPPSAGPDTAAPTTVPSGCLETEVVGVNSATTAAPIPLASVLKITDSDVSGNTACWGGAGVNSLLGQVTVSTSTVDSNTATSCTTTCGGGGVWSEQDKLSLVADTVDSNSVSDGGSPSGFGGGVLVVNDASAALSAGTIGSDSASFGGAVAEVGAGLVLDGTTSQINFVSNTAQDGGAIWNEGGMTLKGSFDLTRNSAVDGGGIYNVGTMSIKGSWPSSSTIYENAATAKGGGIYNHGSLVLDSTGVTYNTAGAPAPSGGGVFKAGGSFSKNASTVVAHNTPDNIAA